MVGVGNLHGHLKKDKLGQASINLTPDILKQRTPPNLRYERVSPYTKGKVPRIWLQEELTLKSFFTDLLKDVWKLLKWLKGLYRKELVVGTVLVLALAPSPHHIQAEASPAPNYIKPIERLQPVQPISVVVPQEAAPVAVPEPVAPPPAPVATPAVGVSGCGDTMYKQFIYQHESGCRTDAVNSIGACGLGQALPCSKMGCSLSDWACHDAFFTSYAVGRYGSWEAAYYYWQVHSWW